MDGWILVGGKIFSIFFSFFSFPRNVVKNFHSRPLDVFPSKMTCNRRLSYLKSIDYFLHYLTFYFFNNSMSMLIQLRRLEEIFFASNKIICIIHKFTDALEINCTSILSRSSWRGYYSTSDNRHSTIMSPKLINYATNRNLYNASSCTRWYPQPSHTHPTSFYLSIRDRDFLICRLI